MFLRTYLDEAADRSSRRTAPGAARRATRLIAAGVAAMLTLPSAGVLLRPPAASATTPSLATVTLPGGSQVTASLAAPAGPLPADRAMVTGQFSVPAQPASPAATLAAISLTTSPYASCPDANGDGVNTLLDCEIIGVEALRSSAATAGQSAMSLIGFNGAAVTADVGPGTGTQTVTSPAADADGNGVADIDQVAASTTATGFGQFTPVSTTTSGVNYQATLNQAATAASGSGASNRRVVFLATAAATTPHDLFGIVTPLVVPAGVRFDTYALNGLACGTATSTTSLAYIAAQSGGTCTAVADPTQLATLLGATPPALQNPALTTVTATLDGGVPTTVTATAPALPASGPTTVTVPLTLPQWQPGSTHNVCLQGQATDAYSLANPTSITTCIDVAIGQPYLTTSPNPDSIVGTPAVPHSLPALSDDGRWVADESAGPIDGDITVRDTATGAIVFSSYGLGSPYPAAYEPVLSASGRYLSFVGLSNGGWDHIWFHNRDVSGSGTFDTSGNTSDFVLDGSNGVVGDNAAVDPSMSSDGRWVAFVSQADNLVTGDTNTHQDVFVRDTTGPAPVRVNLAADGSQANGDSNAVAISNDGRFVAFTSDASNLVPGDTNGSTDVFLVNRSVDGTTPYDLAANRSIIRISAGNGTSGGVTGGVSISGDGRWVTFATTAALTADDTNGRSDVYLYDTIAGTLTRVSRNRDGTDLAEPALLNSRLSPGRSVSDDGTAITFVTVDQTSVPDAAWLWDRSSGTAGLSRADVAGIGCATPSDFWGTVTIRRDGGELAFSSIASNIVPGTSPGYEAVYLRSRPADFVPVLDAGDASSLVAGTSFARHLTYCDRDGQSASYSVDYGDGTAVTNGTVGASGLDLGHVYAAAGNFTLTVTADDGQGGTATYRLPITVTAPLNMAPTVTMSSASGPEGSPVTLTGSFSDPGSTSWTASVVFGDGTVWNGPVSAGSLDFSHTYTDAATYQAAITITDDGGLSATVPVTVNVTNVAPTLSPIAAPASPVAVGTTIQASASATDPGLPDVLTGTWSWGDGSTSPVTISAANGAVRSLSGSHTYTAAGVYQIGLSVADGEGGVATAVYQYAVVYDPNGGFVTGGGWINSPAGALVANPTVTGRANFGFVARYEKGSSVPSGNTEFQFQTGGIDFASSTYQWLVVSGNKAQYKGTGSINGSGSYGFMLSAVDNSTTGVTDTFRIKIWDTATGATVYDNQMGASDGATPSTLLGGGNITIHS